MGHTITQSALDFGQPVIPNICFSFAQILHIIDLLIPGLGG